MSDPSRVWGLDREMEGLKLKDPRRELVVLQSDSIGLSPMLAEILAFEIVETHDFCSYTHCRPLPTVRLGSPRLTCFSSKTCPRVLDYHGLIQKLHYLSQRDVSVFVCVHILKEHCPVVIRELLVPKTLLPFFFRDKPVTILRNL